MSTNFLPTTEEIGVAFADEISTLGGTVTDSYDDGSRLFARALLATEGEVRPGDVIKAGIALRAAGPVVAVYPYTARQICTNGAIAAHVTQARHIPRVEYISATEFVVGALDEIRLAIRESAKPEAFVRVVDEMVRASATSAELMVYILPLLERVPNESRQHLLRHLTEEFSRAADGTVYGVMNAVTAVARETRDPQAKWDLEVYGGKIPARAPATLRKRVPGPELAAV
jgi:hypothetical protein